ncbi:hypothetical protein WOLCODRAFT_39773, partial [Wolfiporia cocos MD-104 SS10]
SVFYFGRGVAFISTARHADVLFVKHVNGDESALAVYRAHGGTTHILFEDFGVVLRVMRGVVHGELSVQE